LALIARRKKEIRRTIYGRGWWDQREATNRKEFPNEDGAGRRNNKTSSFLTVDVSSAPMIPTDSLQKTFYGGGKMGFLGGTPLAVGKA